MNLVFKLKSNDNFLINESTNYEEKKNKLYFILEEESYICDIKGKKLIKEDSEKIITINIDKKEIIIEMKEMAGKFRMLIENGIWKNTEHKIFIKYSFQSDEQITNCIIIDY